MKLKRFIQDLDTKKLLLYFAVLIIIACIVIDIFKILYFELGGDLAYFTIRALSLNNGEIPYTIHTTHSAPFIIYYLWIFFKFFPLNTIYIYLAGFFWEMALLVLIFFMSKKYFGTKKAIIASAIYMVISITFPGLSVGGYHPSAFFGLLGILFYFLFLEKSKKYNLFITGLMIAISIWFMQQGVFFFVAIFIHQLYFYFKKQQSFKLVSINISWLLAGILIISLPLLIYFITRPGNHFIYDIIIFNLFFKTSHSRIIIMGLTLRMLLEYFGFLSIIILAAPRKEESENDKKLISFFWVYAILMVIFLLLNRDIFPEHTVYLLAILAFFSLFFIRRYDEDSKKIIRILLIIGLLTIFMVNLEAVAREYNGGYKEKKEQVADFIISTIPNGSKVYSVIDDYPLLTGFRTSYRETILTPILASMDNLSDFCTYIDSQDYLILTKVQKKYLGDFNLNCTYSKFTLIKTFENIDPGAQDVVEIYKKNTLIKNITKIN